MLESLQPFSETPLTMRVMDVVEALGTIIQRKLNVLRDMESVFPYPFVYASKHRQTDRYTHTYRILYIHRHTDTDTDTQPSM
jgi:hypothetical protein